MSDSEKTMNRCETCLYFEAPPADELERRQIRASRGQSLFMDPFDGTCRLAAESGQGQLMVVSSLDGTEELWVMKTFGCVCWVARESEA